MDQQESQQFNKLDKFAEIVNQGFNEQTKIIDRKFDQRFAQQKIEIEERFDQQKIEIEELMDEKLNQIWLEIKSIKDELKDIKERLDALAKTETEDLKPVYFDMEKIKARLSELELEVKQLRMSNK